MNRPLTSSQIAALEAHNRKVRIAKLAAEEEAEKRHNARVVADWLAAFHNARNAACVGQKNFRGVGA